MKIIVVGSSRWNVYAPAFVSGFTTLGHDVKFIDINDYFSHIPIIGKLLNKIQAKYCVGYPLFFFNKAIKKLVDSFQPDFIFFYSCNHVFESTYRYIHHARTKIFTYNNDDPFGPILIKTPFKYFLKSLKYADINYVYRKKNIIDYNQYGVTNVDLLLPYYLSNVNKDLGLNKDLSVVYIGHFENDGRDLYMKALIEAGIPLKIYSGANWVDYDLDPIVANQVEPAVYGNKYNETLCRSKIALVFFSKLNSDTYTRRCFEIPPTRAVMLSEYTSDMDNLFPSNSCAVYFKNPEELVDKCKFLLSNSLSRDAISQNCIDRLNQIGGSEIDRCKCIINKYTELS